MCADTQGDRVDPLLLFKILMFYHFFGLEVVLVFYFGGA